MIQEIAFTVYAVTDMARSRAFYEGMLGLKPSAQFNPTNSPNWIEYDLGQGTFAIGCSPEWPPSEVGASIAFEVADFDATVAALKKASVPFKGEPGSYPTCSMAVILDPDKNKILSHKRK